MSEKLVITDPHNVQVTFVNQVLGQGHVNGVVNVTLGQARFTPTALLYEPSEGAIDTVETDMIVAARLRMDIGCAKQLRDSLDALLKKLLPEAGESVN